MTLHDLIRALGDRPALFFSQRAGGTGLAVLAEPLLVGQAVVLPSLRGAEVVPVDDILPRLRALATTHGALPVVVWTVEGWLEVVRPETDWLLVAPLPGAPAAVAAEADIRALLGELRRAEREVAEGHPDMAETI